MNVGTYLREFAIRVGLFRSKSKAMARMQAALNASQTPIVERTIGDGDERVHAYESAFHPAPSETTVVPSEAALKALNEKAAAVSGFFVAFLDRNPGEA